MYILFLPLLNVESHFFGDRSKRPVDQERTDVVALTVYYEIK